MNSADRPTADAPPFVRLGEADAPLPVLIAVPHAGRDYPAALLEAARVPPARLEELEDRHADRLIAPALAAGAQAIVATRPRAWIDLNRAETDLDAAMIDPPPSSTRMQSHRALAGLGLIPRRLGTVELWRGPLRAQAIAERIGRDHRPYHAALADTLGRIRARHGIAILVDCHSMPPVPGGARIVIGDRHGRSAAGRFSDVAMAVAAAAGLRPARNAPYAGGHSVERHGRPAQDIHAIQIEFDRTLYLDAALRAPGPGLAHTAALLGEIVAALGACALQRPALAAE